MRLPGSQSSLDPNLEPAKNKAAETYRVGGKRDGPSFFPRVHYPEVKPLKEGELDFRHYPTYGEIHGFLQKWAREHPQILELYSVGWTYIATTRRTGGRNRGGTPPAGGSPRWVRENTLCPSRRQGPWSCSS